MGGRVQAGGRQRVGGCQQGGLDGWHSRRLEVAHSLRRVDVFGIYRAQMSGPRLVSAPFRNNLMGFIEVGCAAADAPAVVDASLLQHVVKSAGRLRRKDATQVLVLQRPPSPLLAYGSFWPVCRALTTGPCFYSSGEVEV